MKDEAARLLGDAVGEKIVVEGLKRGEGPPYPLSRLRIALRRATNEGVGYLLLATLCVTLSAISFRYAFIGIFRYNDRVKTELLDAMRSQQLARSDVLFDGIQTLLLSNIVDGKDGTETAELVMVLAETLKGLVEKAPLGGAVKTDDMRRHVADNTRRLLSLPVRRRALDPLRRAAYAESIRIDLTRVLTAAALPLYKGNMPGDAKLGPHVFDYGPLYYRTRSCGDATFSLLVPALVGRTPKKHVDTERRIAIAWLFSDLLNVIVPSVSDTSNIRRQATLVDAYIITPDNVLGLWNPQVTDPQRVFPPSRLWASPQYFQKWLQESEPKELTPPYLDYGGYGVLRTWSQPVYVNGRLAATVNLDYTVPTNVVTNARAGSPFVQVEPIEIQIHGDVATGNYAPAGREHRGADDRRRNAELSGAIGEIARSRGVQSLMRDVSRPSVAGGETSFLVPLGPARLAGGQGEATGLLVTIREPGPPPLTSGLAMGGLLMLVLGLSATFSAMNRARRASEEGVQQSLLRGLQVGILVADQDDRIESANDRAEKMLGVPLPRTTDRHLQRIPPPRADHILEGNIIIASDAGLPDRVVPYYPTIKDQRERGESSVYFARMARGRNKGHWIRVSASPLLSHGDHVRERKTFAVVQPPSDDDVRSATDKLKQYTEGGTP
jgi:PAS domain-containing protein